METAVYRQMRDVEDRHWWFSGLRRLVLETAVPVLSRPAARALDAGCGTGGTMSALAAATSASVAGVDVSPLAVAAARARRVGPVLRASVESLPFATATFDLVTCLDVLYIHGVDDRVGVAELRRVLRPGGSLVVNLAAFEWLRGAHDVAVHTERRYTRARVRMLLEAGGLRVVRLGYWNATLLPVLAAWRPLTRLRGVGTTASADLALPPAPVNAALAWLVGREIEAMRHVRLPFGSSVFAVAVKDG